MMFLSFLLCATSISCSQCASDKMLFEAGMTNLGFLEFEFKESS